MMGVAISVTAVCATISSPFWGRLSDKASRKTVLQISQCFSLVGYALLAAIAIAAAFVVGLFGHKREGKERDAKSRGDRAASAA